MEESQANFLESRVQPTPRNAPARGKGSGPAKARSEATRRGPGVSRPAPLGAPVAHWATLSGPLRWVPPLVPLAGAAPWPLSGKAWAWLRGRRGLRGPLGPLCPVTRARCSSQCGTPATPCLSLSAASEFERPRFQPGSQFPRRV